MSARPDVMDGFDATAQSPAARERRTRPLYWSVRRELWENRSLIIVPLIVAGVSLLGLLWHEMLPPHEMPVDFEFNAPTVLLMAGAFVLGVVYCLDALHGERRDRSSLFWKSMPVSDTTTVLSKLAVPLVVLPLIVLVIILATQLVVLIVSMLLALGDAGRVTELWDAYSLLTRPPRLVYALLAAALWHAPIYAWLLLVSGWARRAPFVWALLPLAIAFVIEMFSFGTNLVPTLLGQRVFGWSHLAFANPGHGMSFGTRPTPERFLASRDLWLGLVLAAVLVVAAIRLRRQRDPI